MIGEIPGEPTNDVERAFLEWLRESQYASAVDHCPVEKGEYIGANADEYDAVSEFLSDNPEYEEHEEELIQFASNFAPFTTIFNGMDDDDREMRRVPQGSPSLVHHRLLWLSVVGGWLDGLRLEFSDGLNCIIGGRGTGKTTLLELVRFVLDAASDQADKDSQKKLDALIAKNLAFGRVELGIETKERMSYIVTRTPGEKPVVLTADREPTELILRLGNLFKADIFSQNQVEGIADRWDSQLALLDSFDQAAISQHSVAIKKLVDQLRANATAIVPLRSRAVALTEETRERASIEEQLKGMAASGSGDANLLNTIHAQKALRDRESRVQKRLEDDIKQIGEALGTLIGSVSEQARLTITREMLEGPNAAIFTAMLADAEQAGTEIDQSLEQARTRLRKHWTTMQKHLATLVANHGAQDVQYREILEKQKAANADNDKRAQLEKRRNDLLSKEHELKAVQAQEAKLVEERASMLEQLTDRRHRRFVLREEIAKRLTKDLKGDIRITITQDGRPDRYREKLEELLQGSRVQSKDKDKIIDAMWPSDLVAIVKSGGVEALIDKAGIGKPTAERVIDVLAASPNLSDLESVELIDEPKIELNDNGTWKDSRDLSTGQKCTAILPILLMESEKPLLIDQPEDNLDNRYVSDKVVRTICSVKQRRQLIFVTHNPNIPVLGDAERVFVLESSGTAGTLAQAGTVSDCKVAIINLLEGGKQAFEERAKRYDGR